jgi:putative ABC transport system permease protein
VGFSVLFSIANQQAASRRWDIGLLKSLGASKKAVTHGLLLQFALIASLAAAFGFLLSLVFSYVISRFLFNNVWFFDWTTPALLLVSTVGATVLVTWISIRRALAVEARDLLNR